VITLISGFLIFGNSHVYSLKAGMKNQSSQKETSSKTENLSQAEALQLILNNAEDAFLLLDKELRIVLANQIAIKNTKELSGIGVAKGMSIFEISLPGKYEALKTLYNKVLGGIEQTEEKEIILNDGSVKCFQNHFKPAKDEHGNIVGIVVRSKEITERKGSIQEQTREQNLKLSEQQYKTLFQNNPLPCWIYDFNTLQFLEVNEAAVRYYGYSEEEFLKLTILDLQIEENVALLKNRFRTKKIKRVDFLNNWQHKLKDGRSIFVDLRSSEITYRGVKARLVVANDVTPRVVTEVELRKSNERFRLAANATSEALWEWDVLTEEAYISSTYTDILGWRADEFRKFDEWHDYIHPDDKKETVKSYYDALGDAKAEKWKKEYRYLKSDGSYAFVSDKAVIVRDEQGKAIKVIGALQNITGQKETEEELKKSNERFVLASRAASDHIYEWDILSNALYWGESSHTLFGFQPHELTMALWEKLIHPKERKKTIGHLHEVLAHPEKNIWEYEYRLANANGVYSYVLERGFIVRDEEGIALRMIGSLQDISRRKFNEQLLSLERSIFELSANPDLDIREVVDTLLKGIEEIYSEALTSVLLLKDDNTIEHLAAPRLPVEYIQGINGLKIGPEEGSCGAAMSLKKTIVAANIENDPRWVKYKDFAGRFNLKACWSLPIIHTSGKVMGSFAIYHKTPQDPTTEELTTVERLRNILRIVMENRWSLQEIKTANERFDIMMKATHDLIWDWDLETNTIYRDPLGLQQVYGTDNNEPIGSIQKWLERIHSEDHPRVEKTIGNILESTNENTFEVEYRFKRDDGTYAHVYDRGIIIRNENNKPLRMIGAAQDISERKQLEKELLNNELDHQRAINLATIETQEQERSEIGKELHDNVNQVLTTTKLYLDLALSNPELKDELIQKSTKNIINVINEIRQLSRSLMDPSIGDLGLIDSIHDLTENINLTRKLHVSLDVGEEIEDLLDKNQKLTIYRIIQEALNNAIKHAQATSVLIRILHNASSAEVIIEDDGVGFNVKTVKKGAGLKNMQNRIYLINGEHIIESTPNQGSKIIIKFPIIQTKNLYPL
jgi:PAS domain S-box-containing protein